MLYVQSYLYILEDESVTLGDEFLSVDQLSTDFSVFMSQSYSYHKKKRLNQILVKFTSIISQLGIYDIFSANFVVTR